MESDFQINQIMQRYNLTVDEKQPYSNEEIKSLGIDHQFIHSLLRTFEDEKTFSEEQYRKFPLEIIIDYIRRTHQYYLTKKLCEIEQSIHLLLKDYSGNHPLLHILNDFFFDYTTDLTKHINIEEKLLLPYIDGLLKFEKGESETHSYFVVTNHYSLQAFIDSHHDTEKDLSNVRTAILCYDPPRTNQTPYRILVSQLELFEKDLSVHGLIEDKVLIPRALQLEETTNHRFLAKIKCN